MYRLHHNGGQYGIYTTKGQRIKDSVNPVPTQRRGATDLYSNINLFTYQLLDRHRWRNLGNQAEVMDEISPKLLSFRINSVSNTWQSNTGGYIQTHILYFVFILNI